MAEWGQVDRTEPHGARGGGRILALRYISDASEDKGQLGPFVNTQRKLWRRHDAAYKKMLSANICQREYHPVEEKKYNQIDKLNYYKG